MVDFLTQLVAFTNDNADEIRKLKDNADEAIKSLDEFELAWEINPEVSEDLFFKGYEYVRSEDSGERRRRGVYDHMQPWEEIIPHFTEYNASLSVKRPYAYILPQN